MNLSRFLVFLTMFSLGAAEPLPTKMAQAYLKLSEMFGHTEKSFSWSEIFDIDGEGTVFCPECKTVMCQDSSSLQNGKKGLDEICEEHCKKGCSFSSPKSSSAQISEEDCKLLDSSSFLSFKPLSRLLGSISESLESLDSEGKKSTDFLSSPSYLHFSSDECFSPISGSPSNFIETQKPLLSLGGVGASTLLSKRKKVGQSQIKQ